MLKFPTPDEAVEDIAHEMRSVPRSGEFLYELVRQEVDSENCVILTFERREMTLAKLADRMDAAIKRREDEAARLWKAVGELEEWLGRITMLDKDNAQHLVQCVLGHYGLQKKEGAK